MNDEHEKQQQEPDEALESRWLRAEGQIQALTQVVMHLMAELEVRHGLDSEKVEQRMKSKHWDGLPIEPYAKDMMQDMADRLSHARQGRLYSLLYERYGLDLDLELRR
ncbi:hypothetical protein BFW38_06340 [Terasakiispira papahanaumokuakeensis]|uniref:Uncharacterized protein n=1 Tax=Terasakiispira papahanaumokuakeensis TaxID=197479 RepID=A0A1E2V879_9GAMM|nr:hypothetical protein [Terasakiispira papahanaumokuakeensis]ODC03218.1 hypothetical protein BFW38_06340 [Terasakiispira papahanaumokuakeensis]